MAKQEECKMNLLFLFAVLFHVNSPTFAVQCPNVRDEHFEGYCYSFHKNSSVTNYDLAAKFCEHRNRTLAASESSSQLMFMANAIERQYWNSALVGLRFVQSTWRWTADHSLLRGQGCHEQISVDDSQLIGSGIYSSSMTVDKCIADCLAIGGDFAAVMSGSMCYCASSFVWKKQASSCSLPCSGALSQNCGSVLNSLVFSTNSNAYDNWQLGNPSVGGSCGAVKIDKSANRWVATSCNLVLPPLCQHALGANIENFGLVAATKCEANFCLSIFQVPESIWSEAETFCTKFGGNLAKIDSLEKQLQLNALVLQIPESISQFWIGASNRYWRYHKSDNFVQFRGWVSVSEPAAPEYNQCAMMSIQGDGSYGWKTKLCSTLDDTSNNFVCRIQISNYTSTSSPSSTTSTTTTTTTTKTTSTITLKPTPAAVRAETTTKSTTGAIVVQSTVTIGTTSSPLQATVQSLVTTKGSNAVGTTTSRTLGVTASISVATTVAAQPKATNSPITNVEGSQTTVTPKPIENTVETIDSNDQTTRTDINQVTTLAAQVETTVPGLCSATCRNVTSGSSFSVECWDSAKTAPQMHNDFNYSSNYQRNVDCQMLVETEPIQARPISGAQKSPDQNIPYTPAPETTYSQTNNSNKDANEGTSWWIILIIVIACLAVFGVALGLGIYFCKRSAKNRVRDANSASSSLRKEGTDVEKEETPPTYEDSKDSAAGASTQT